MRSASEIHKDIPLTQREIVGLLNGKGGVILFNYIGSYIDIIPKGIILTKE
jgi:hypothetical protein